MSDEDGLFMWRADLTPEEIEQRIVEVLAAGNPSPKFLNHLRAIFDRKHRKKIPFVAKIHRTAAHRPKQPSRSAERAAAARKALAGASAGQVEGIIKDVADHYGKTTRTIYSDLSKQRERDELWKWMTENKSSTSSHEEK